MDAGSAGHLDRLGASARGLGHDCRDACLARPRRAPVGGAAGGDADEPAPGIGLRLQCAAAPDRAGAGHPALGAVARLRPVYGGLHGGLGRRRLSLSCSPGAGPGAGERAVRRRWHRSGGDGERARAIAAGLRHRVRHRRRRGLHPAAAGRKHAGAAAPGAGERLHRQPLPDGRHGRDAPLPCLQRGLRLAHDAGGARGRAGGERDSGGAACPAWRGAAGRAGSQRDDG